MPHVTETAFRMACAALLVDTEAQHLPVLLRTLVQGYLASKTSAGRVEVEAEIRQWLTRQGTAVGRELRQAFGDTTDAALPEPEPGFPGESASARWRRKMPNIHDHDPEINAPGAATGAMGGDTMTALAQVIDQMNVAPYNTPPEKLQKAYETVLEQRVRLTNLAAVVEVQSAQPAEGWYRVTGAFCTCPYSQHHPGEEFGCYHTVAARLYGRWQQAQAPLIPPQQETRMEAPTLTTALPLPLYEAPYSATVSVEDAAGYDWLLTIRKTDAAAFGKAILGMSTWCEKHGLKPHPRPQHRPGALGTSGTAPQTPGGEIVPPAPQQPPVCAYHGTMKPSTVRPGTYHCTKKMADGTYCREEWPKAA